MFLQHVTVTLLEHSTIQCVIEAEDSVNVSQALEGENVTSAFLVFIISQVKAAQVTYELDL